MKEKSYGKLRLISLIIIMMFVIINIPTNALAEASTTITVSNYNTLKTSIDNASADGTETIIIISSNITFSSTITIPVGKNITIQSASGQNYVLSCTIGRHFYIEGELTLSNIALDGGGQKGGVHVDCYISYSITAGVWERFEGTLTMNSGAIIQNCYASDPGGGVSVKNSNFNLNGGDIKNNISAYSGGGVSVQNGTFNMLGGSISKNKAQNGGGIYTTGNCTFNMTGGDVSENEALSYGGGIGFGEGTFTLTKGVITNNSSNSAGGIIIGSDGTFIMNGGTINNNVAKVSSGGGVYVHDTFIMNGGTIENNTAYSSGGGVYVSGFVNDSIYIYGTVTINGGSINKNTATNGVGGGVRLAGGNLIIKNGTISGNIATNGGGIFVNGGSDSGTLYMEGGKIDNNEAFDCGGGVYLQSGAGIYTDGATFNMINGTICNNTAKFGGGVYLEGGSIDDTLDGLSYVNGGILLMNDGLIKNNIAISSGGGIYVDGNEQPASFIKNAGAIIDNIPDNIRYNIEFITDISVSKASTTSIKISWIKSNNFDGYEVYYSTSKNGAYTKTVATNGTSYTHKNLTIGQTYYYKVRAYKTVNVVKYYSDYTDVKSLTLPVPKPANLKITNTGATSLKISWGKVNGVTGYEVYRSTTKNGTYSKIATTSSNAYNNKSLANGKTYYYKVRAYKTINGINKYSGYSGIISKKAILSVPSSFKVKKASSTSIKISWKKVNGATGYEIYRSTSKKGTYKKITTVSGSKSSYTNKSLKKGKTYYYKIRAVQKTSNKTYKSAYTGAKKAN